MSASSVSDEDYRKLLELRSGLRRFLKWSADQALDKGLTGRQHQLLLAVRGHADAAGPTIGEVAEYLQLRHHSTVELIDRAVANGLVERRSDPEDARLVRLGLTKEGDRRLSSLAGLHLAELARMAPRMSRLWAGLGGE